jgi:hypothetical protein
MGVRQSCLEVCDRALVELQEFNIQNNLNDQGIRDYLADLGIHFEHMICVSAPKLAFLESIDRRLNVQGQADRGR